MKSKPKVIQPLTIRRAVVADTDKVRYRVYSTPTKFIAVIAESALMAVKVSGITKPHKIVRDLPTEGIAIGAKKMATQDNQLPRVNIPTQHTPKPTRLSTQVADIDPDARQALFRPMNIGDLQHGGTVRARILPPDLLSEIIEQHAKAHIPSAPATPAPPAPDLQPTYAPAPVIAPISPPPQLSPTERLLQAAEEVLPAANHAAAEQPTLSPEEVEKLLNG
jgi:hypothetical protein